MVDLARLVAEGAVPGSEDQRAEALRLFGVGLYLSGRRSGAERAFIDLLKLRPKADFDPDLTRPDVVAFFRDVRRRNRPSKYRALAFLPPLGQFQNEHPGRGWLIGSLELATLGTFVTSRLLLESWLNDDRTCREPPFDKAPCERLQLIQYVSFGAFLATYTAGVIEALVSFQSDDDSEGARYSLLPFHRGAALRVTF